MKSTKRTMKNDLRMMDINIGLWRLQGGQAAQDGDAELAKQYARDGEYLTAFRDAVARGEVDDARRIADTLDALVRDQIPIRLLDTGMWRTEGKTPSATLHAAVCREIATKGDKRRFVKTGRGLFGLNR